MLKKKKKRKRSPSGKSYILYGFEICFFVFKILSMAYLIFCLYVRYWQPWLLLKCRSKAASLHGLYSPFELFFPLINLTIYISTIQKALCIAKLSAEKKIAMLALFKRGTLKQYIYIWHKLCKLAKVVQLQSDLSL